jgi:hypothetical protein
MKEALSWMALWGEVEELQVRGSFARDSMGNNVDLFSPYAASFCLMGAIRRIGDREIENKVIGKISGVLLISYQYQTLSLHPRIVLVCEFLERWNDRAIFEERRAAIRQTIAELELI